MSNYHTEVKAKKIKLQGLTDMKMVVVDFKNLNATKESIRINYDGVIGASNNWKSKQMPVLKALLTNERFGRDLVEE